MDNATPTCWGPDFDQIRGAGQPARPAGEVTGPVAAFPAYRRG